jgi:hypothetical protein
MKTNIRFVASRALTRERSNRKTVVTIAKVGLNAPEARGREHLMGWILSCFRSKRSFIIYTQPETTQKIKNAARVLNAGRGYKNC